MGKRQKPILYLISIMWEFCNGTCTFFLTLESSEGPVAESLRSLFSDFFIKSVISCVRVSIARWSSLPSPNDGIKAFEWALANSAIFVRARCTFADISSDKSTHAGGSPTVIAFGPLLYPLKQWITRHFQVSQKKYTRVKNKRQRSEQFQKEKHPFLL